MSAQPLPAPLPIGGSRRPVGDLPVPPARAPRRTGGVLGLTALATWTEFRASLRAPEFAVGAMGIPLILYAMFGLTNDSVLPAGTPVNQVFLVSMGAYGTVSMAIFVFGEDVAKERGRGWLRTMRATPLPTSVHLLGKVLNAVLMSFLVVAAMCLLAAGIGGVRATPAEWTLLVVGLVGAVLLFAPLGFAIAFAVRPRAAAVVANLIFLPLAFASGFFMPLSELPAVMQRIAELLPTYHYGQLLYRIVMPDADVELWTAALTGPAWVHVTWVAGSFVLLTAVALVSSRREAVTRRG